jgi:catechol 2,3-dioxygenase-like lactoylglutathione lyase family enzyme
MSTPLVEARRFLHCCYCCPDSGVVSQFFTEGLGMNATMRTNGGKSDGSLLGIDGEVESDARFVYDRRGPRTSPAVEVQGWLGPPVEGEVYPAAHHVGFHAVGVAVPDVDGVVQALAGLGATVVGRTADADALFGSARAVVVRAADGVLVDIVESAQHTSTDTDSRFHHMRLTCSDLEASLAWYEALGFSVVARHDSVEVSAGLFGGPTDGVVAVAQLRLPDEPFRLLLHQWLEPASYGHPYPNANHRGMYRAAVCVDDTRASYDTLTGEGFVFDAPPRVVTLTGTPVPDMWIAFLRDPDGFPVELVERPRSAFR